jgi:hypothetical protein
MLKFSGYSYLIRGQPLKNWGFSGKGYSIFKSVIKITALRDDYDSAVGFEELQGSYRVTSPKWVGTE